ncbi:MAG: prenyltransferase [Candidatus Dadabacteria bacterium]|nr:MAG: prenyltransferase [Candidatus Dadabacteria bacterium]
MEKNERAVSGARLRAETMRPEQGTIRLRAVALPAEHGSWGLVLEPIALGLAVAPSTAGLAIAVAAFAGFLLRRPFKVALAARAGERPERMPVALRFIALYGAVAVLAAAAALLLVGLAPLAPTLAVSPLVLVFLAYDLRNQSRSWQPEVAGSVFFASVAASIARAGNWPLGPALALSAALALRASAAVAYVRARIRLERGRPASRLGPLLAHLGALAAAAALVAYRLLPGLALVAFGVLGARAAVGLSSWRRPITTTRLGFTEMGYGALTVAAIAAGWYLE